MRKPVLALLAFLVAIAFVLYLVSRPVTIPAAALPGHAPDIANGKYLFIAGGCAECHAAPVKGCDDLNIESKEVLAGGRCSRPRSARSMFRTSHPIRRSASAAGAHSISSTR